MHKDKAAAPTNEVSDGGPAASLVARKKQSFAVTQLRSRLDGLQAAIDSSPRQLAQRRHIDSLLGGAVLQRQGEAPPRDAGLPEPLKSGIESLSGLSMEDVRVHHNSTQPAQFGALAYAQGNNIHLGPGQEQHLPHEAWHVVQQRQGRVHPTTEVRGKAVNDAPELESEADRMGAVAAENATTLGTEAHSGGAVNPATGAAINNSPRRVAQRQQFSRLIGEAPGLPDTAVAAPLQDGLRMPHESALIRQRFESPSAVLQSHVIQRSEEVPVEEGELEKRERRKRKVEEKKEKERGEGREEKKAKGEEKEEKEDKEEEEEKWFQIAFMDYTASPRPREWPSLDAGKTGGKKSNDPATYGIEFPRPSVISEMHVIQDGDKRGDHWSLMCTAKIDQSTETLIKIDLVKASYRVMYGAKAAPELGRAWKAVSLIGKALKAEGIYEAVVATARSKGKWTGDKEYNCQDFVKALFVVLEIPFPS